jgi:hypothetical protein
MNLLSFEPSPISGLHKPKAKWSLDEDQLLLRLIHEQGARHWNQIAESIPGRTGKQCRERWLSKLSPDFTPMPWTAEEDQALLRCQSTHGNQWAKFRVELPNRSVIQIKNRWVSLVRRGSACRGERTTIPCQPARSIPVIPECVHEAALADCEFGEGIFDTLPFPDPFGEVGMWTF